MLTACSLSCLNTTLGVSILLVRIRFGAYRHPPINQSDLKNKQDYFSCQINLKSEVMTTSSRTWGLYRLPSSRLYSGARWLNSVRHINEIIPQWGKREGRLGTAGLQPIHQLRSSLSGCFTLHFHFIDKNGVKRPNLSECRCSCFLSWDSMFS
jgi:hypothetical protein